MPHMNERRTDATNGGKYATEREIGIICRTNKHQKPDNIRNNRRNLTAGMRCRDN